MASITNKPGRPRSFDQDEVLEKAMWAFFQHGFEGTSSRDLQAATGLTAPSLYNAFGAKHDIYLAALNRYVRLGFEYMINDLADGSGGLDDLDQFLQKVWSTFEGAHPAMGCMVLNARGEFGRGQPDILATCDTFTNRQVRAFSAALQRAANLGEIDPSFASRYVQCFRMMLNGLLHLVRTNGLDEDVRETFAAIRQTVREWNCGDSSQNSQNPPKGFNS